MTFFWSSWVTILSIVCWLGILGVLLMVLKYKPEVEEDGTTGHDYDGIQEYDKPLPKWWLVIFFGTIVWGAAYWLFFPGLQPASWDGIATVEVDGETVPWTSTNELFSELEENNKIFTENFEQSILVSADATGATETLNKLSTLQASMRRSEEPPADLQTQIDEKIAALSPYVERLSENPNALKVGSRLFLQNCAVCHGSNAKGAAGFPNLTDNDWLHGGEPKDILRILHHGQHNEIDYEKEPEKLPMPAWRDQIGEDGVRAAAEYVLSLSPNNGHPDNGELDSTLVSQGGAIFAQECALCHGTEGKGMTSLGAPNLTNTSWLYGGKRETVRNTLRYGRAGVMPAWDTKLGNERIMLLAAYVYSLSDRTDQANANITATATTPDSAGNTEATSAN